MNFNGTIRPALLTMMLGFQTITNGQQIELSTESDIETPVCKIENCDHVHFFDAKESHLLGFMEFETESSEDDSKQETLLLDESKSIFYPMGNFELTSPQKKQVLHLLEFGFVDSQRSPKHKVKKTFIEETLQGKVVDLSQLQQPYTLSINDAEMSPDHEVQVTFSDNHGNKILSEHHAINSSATGVIRRSARSAEPQPMQLFMNQLISSEYCPEGQSTLECFRSAADQSLRYEVKTHRISRRQSPETTEPPTQVCIPSPLAVCESSLEELQCELNRANSSLVLYQRDVEKLKGDVEKLKSEVSFAGNLAIGGWTLFGFSSAINVVTIATLVACACRDVK